MPISDEAQKLAAVMQQLQAGAQQQQLMKLLGGQGSAVGSNPMMGAMMGSPQTAGTPQATQVPSPSASPNAPGPSLNPGIASLLQGVTGGQPQLQPPTNPQTLGIGHPLPMQQPSPDPQGATQQPPIDPSAAMAGP